MIDRLTKDTLVSFIEKNGIEGNFLRHKTSDKRYIFLGIARMPGGADRRAWILRSIPSLRLIAIEENDKDSVGQFETCLDDKMMDLVVNALNNDSGE